MADLETKVSVIIPKYIKKELGGGGEVEGKENANFRLFHSRQFMK